MSRGSATRSRPFFIRTHASVLATGSARFYSNYAHLTSLLFSQVRDTPVCLFLCHGHPPLPLKTRRPSRYASSSFLAQLVHDTSAALIIIGSPLTALRNPPGFLRRYSNVENNTTHFPFIVDEPGSPSDSEMRHSFIGPVPIETFLNDLLVVENVPPPSTSLGFADMARATSETNVFRPFVRFFTPLSLISLSYDKSFRPAE